MWSFGPKEKGSIFTWKASGLLFWATLAHLWATLVNFGYLAFQAQLTHAEDSNKLGRFLQPDEGSKTQLKNRLLGVQRVQIW